MPTGGGGTVGVGPRTHIVLVNGKQIGPSYAHFDDARFVANEIHKEFPQHSISVLDDRGHNVGIA